MPFLPPNCMVHDCLFIYIAAGHHIWRSCPYPTPGDAAGSLQQSTQQQQQQPFNGLFSRTTWVSRYQKGKTNLDFTGARDREWQWHRLGHMQVRNSLQTDNHTSTSPPCFLQAGCPSCHPTNSVKALKCTNQKCRDNLTNEQTFSWVTFPNWF